MTARAARATGRGTAGESRSSPVDDPAAARAVLVDPAREVEALEDELDGGGNDRRLLGAIGDVERPERPDDVVEARDHGHPADVFPRWHAIAGLDDEPLLERQDDVVEVIEVDPTAE